MTKPGGTIQPGGNFFVATHQALGKTTRTFEVINSYGVSATTTHDLIGIPPGSNDFDRDSLVDLSTITDSYGITSFDARQDTLYADLQITNTGDIPITAPFLVGLRNLSDASVSLLGIDGYWDDGTPYIDFSDQLESSDLLPGDSTVFDPIAFDVPERSPFTYDLVLLGGLNREPRFTSVPVTNARGGSGQTYSAPVTGVDPDGHAVEFELVTSPVGMTIQDLGGGYATLSWSNIPAEQATYPVTLRVSDSLGASSTQTFVIRTIDASVNRPPVFVTTPIIDAYAESDYEYNANARDIDGDPIAYTLSAFRLDDPSQTELAGLAGSDAPIQFDPSTASITWSPAGEDAGVVHFVLTADDGRGGIDTQVFDVLVHPVADNYPPRFTSVPATRIAAGDVFVYQATAVDPDLDPTTFQPVSLPAGASLTPDGMLQFATAQNTTASHEFTIDVRDGRGHIVTQSFTIDAIDESPATLSGHVYHDVDADGVFNGADQGVPEILVFIDSNANFRHDPGETSVLSDSSGNYTLSLSPPGAFRIAFDRGSQWSTLGPQGLVHTGVATAGQTIADLDIRLAARAPANNAPEIVSTPPQTARYLETYTYDVNATDLDGDSLFYELLAVPSGVTLDPVTGLLTWIPGLSSNGGKSGTDQLSVRVTDGNGGSDTQTWWPDIVFENAAPHFVSVADPIATVDLPYQYAALAIDPDGDRLTYSLDPASLSRGMVIDADSGQINWTPAAVGTYPVLVSAADPRGAFSTQTVNITVGTDAFPIFDMPAVIYRAVGEDTPLEIVVSDPDGDAVTIELDQAAIDAGASIQELDLDDDDLAEPALVFVPPAVAEIPLTLRAFDPAGHLAQWTVTVISYQPNAENRPPEITSVPAPILRRDLAMRVTNEARDPDYDDLIWSVDASGLPAGNDFSLDIQTGQVTWTPSVEGEFTVTYTVTDPDGATDQAQVTYTVLANAPPRFTSIPVRTGSVDQSYTYASQAVDPNGEVVEYFGDVLPTVNDFGRDPTHWPSVDAVIDPATGMLTWTPSAVGTYWVVLYASDPNEAIGTQAYFIEITDIGENQPPDILENPPPRRLLSPATSTQSAVPLDVMIPAIDPNNDPLSFSLFDGPDGMTITSAGRVQWTPTAGDVGRTGTYVVRVSDGRGGVDSEVFQYEVNLDAASQNQPPEFQSDPRRRALATRPYAYNANAIDPDNDRLTYSLSQGPVGMSIHPDTGLVRFTPSLGQLGEHTVSIVASDIAGASDTQTFTLRVVRGDAPPQIISSPSVHSREGDFYHYAVTATDDDGDQLVFSFDTGTAANLPLSIDPFTGVISGITPTQASYDIVVRATDPTGRFDTQSYTLNVTADGSNGANNRPPVIISEPKTTARSGTEYVFDFAAIDPDLDFGDFLTWTKSPESPSTTNSVTFDTTTQQLRWLPDASEIDSTIQFALKVEDSFGASSSISWLVWVREPNVAPQIADIDDQFVVAGATLAVDVDATDPNNDPLTYGMDPASLGRGITIDDLGRVRWETSATDLDSPTQTVTVTVSDGFADPVSTTFDVTLLPDNAPPEVYLDGSPGFLDAGDDVDLLVRAFDNVAVVDTTLTLVSVTDFDGQETILNWDVPLSDAGAARFLTDVSHLGSLRFVATASDAMGLTASDEFVLRVFDPSDTNRPQVTLISPQSGDAPLSPVDIVGTVSDDIAAGLFWTLTIQALDSSAAPRILTRGQGPVTAAPLELLDPTNLRDGAYTLTLSAIDAGGNTASDSETIDIKTDLKLGNFAVSFTDLEVPVAGLPITITRSYDTLDADVMGDFGYGWSLEFTMPKMYVVRSSLGVPSFEGYGTFINGTRVNVVTPEGNTEGFTFFWRPGSEGINNIGVNGSTRYIPTFEGDSGNQYRLIPPASDGHFRRLTEEGPHQDDSGRLYSGLDPVFGGVFQLKQADSRGQQLDYDILVGPRGTVEMTAHRVRDKCGNALELQPDGIRSNRGRSVQFIRDGAGRITEIIDPRGNSMLYRYNSDGQLVEFYDRRATERLRDEVQNNEFAPTRFAYGPEFPDNAFSSVPGVENYLTEIIDPLGITAVQQTYDPVSGRLQSLQDADGNEQEMAYDIRIDEAGVQSQTSGLNPVESTFDQFNRLTSEKTASGQTTLYTYADDDIRYPYQIIQVIGDPDGADAWADRSGDDRVTTRQYQTEFAGQGAVSEEVDPDGQRTLTAYHFRGSERGYPKRVIHPDEKLTDYKWGTQGLEQKVELVAQVDQDGNSTEYGYDDYGNVNVLHQGNEITGTLSRTGFVYDTFGDLVAVEDADQNVRKITYNLNGDQTGTEFAHYPGDQRPPREFELRYLVDEYGETNNLDPADFPATRTLIRTVNDLDVEGDVLTSRTEVVQQTFDADTMEYIDDGPVEVRNDGASTAYDALGRAAESQSENGRRTLTVYDKRGLAVETYTEAPNENGAASWFVSRTVYDSQGRAVHSTGSFPLGTPVSEITGTHSIYDTDVAVDLDDDGIVDSDLSGAQTGRMLGSDQLVGTEITVTPIAGSPTIDIVHNDQVFSIATLATSSLTQAGTKISHSRSFYDDNDRVTSTENDKGLRTQTLYDDDGRVIESRSEMTPSNIGGTIQSYWSVSRTLYDEDGKVLASTDRFLVPIDTPLGQDPVDGQGGSAPVATQVTMTRYDDQDRTIATERYVGAIVSPITGEFGFEIASPGTLESVSETLYDAAGRVWRSVSGRIPYATASTTEQQQSDALSNYPIYGFDEDNQTIQDAYHGLGLTTGIITDTLFDDRGRQFATLGHPLLASELGLTSGDLPAAAPAPESTLVRHRSETIYNGYGQTQIQRSGLAQLQGLGAAHIDVIDIDSVDMVSHYDAFGNVDRMEYVTGGTLALDTVATLDRDAHVRTGGSVDSYTRTRFDDENRPLAEMQQTAGSVATMWNDEQQSFVVDTGIVGGGDLIPTKLYHYDEDDRLEAVTLATLESIDPNSLEIVQQRATYHYQYDDRGNQVGIIDPLGRHTRFQFDDRGRQVSRTLPLGLGPDGEFGTSDDPASFDPGQNGAFTEGFQYDQEGRQTIQTSFEGEITQSIYDAYDRMWAMNYFASQADFDNNRVT